MGAAWVFSAVMILAEMLRPLACGQSIFIRAKPEHIGFLVPGYSLC